MNVFVTGGTGFLGRHLVQALKADGHLVTQLLRPWSYRTIHDQFYRSKPDVVVHLAAYYRAEHQMADLDPMFLANISLPTVLCEAMRARGLKHLIVAGTAWQDFNGRIGVPANLYAATKNAADALIAYYVDAHDFRVVNLRLINVYGPDDHRQTLMNAIKDGMALTAGEQETAFVHVDAAVQMLQSAIDRVQIMPAATSETYAGWVYTASLRETLTTMYPGIVFDWGAKPYRSREMMQLPTHLPVLESAVAV